MAEGFDLLSKTAGLRERFEEVTLLITDPQVIADQSRFERLSREYKELREIVDATEHYARLLRERDENKELLAAESDTELLGLVKEELARIDEELPPLEEQIKLLLLPKDPEDRKNAIVEIRSGTGGDEAALFAGDLYKMYLKYCETRGWKCTTTAMSEGTLGGFKEVIFTVEGDQVYGTLKYESGVHRVQRVPQTETQGRIHTSAASVAVLPEAEEVDIEIRDADIRIDTFNSSGAGGQSVNTTYSAVRIVHIPTGIVVQSQDERSQLKNKERAMNELRTRVYNLEHQKYLDEIASKRKTMVSTGDRSAKIRTYNFPQGRVTDHRINLTLYRLADILDGDIQPLIDAITIAENAESLKSADL